MASGKISKLRKPSISIFGLSPELARVLDPIKQSLETIEGSRAGMSELKGLKTTATNAEIAEKINEIIARLNASGNY